MTEDEAKEILFNRGPWHVEVLYGKLRFRNLKEDTLLLEFYVELPDDDDVSPKGKLDWSEE